MRDEDISPQHVRVGASTQTDTRAAVREATACIDPRDTCFVLALMPQSFDREVMAQELTRHMDGVPVFGCTTAGQITAHGYETGALQLIAFPREHFRCASLLIEPLKPISITEIAAQATRHAVRFQRTAGWNRLALILSDGLSKQEDLLISTLETVLDDLPVFGGSAGDGLSFGETLILHNGQFRSNVALLMLLETDLQFQGIGFDHFLPTDTQLVITDADPEERLVKEINGAPAAQEYARLVGCGVADLSPQIFAENPILVRYNQNYYVRAISSVKDGQALSFLAAIDDGVVLTLGKGTEIIKTLEAGLGVSGPGGLTPDFILGFDCVLRKLEIEQKQLGGEASALFRAHKVLGFNTYGEQHCGVHMNQTFVGVAFFDPAGRALG
ncbi:FIST C-terminal domain-containing protein [Mameliella sp. CS4]|uniref:FIST N-terminal domain-containing protein n=1 Tax=Mameliella sp. CS4 TaxID=2862329 RepID=UPI001C60097A|nr:FIST N-terminal domain-containing protein [Mameliella sp. CS4]MBW4985764.1 FIST C-terminal domain-containing protein [Mameliella sp. CS4]